MKAWGCWTSFEYFDYQQTPLDEFDEHEFKQIYYYYYEEYWKKMHIHNSFSGPEASFQEN